MTKEIDRLEAAIVGDRPAFPAQPLPAEQPSMLRGGFPGDVASMDEFCERFLANVTREEAQILAALPPIKRVTEMISTVVLIRQQPVWELPPTHPLSRGEA